VTKQTNKQKGPRNTEKRNS